MRNNITKITINKESKKNIKYNLYSNHPSRVFKSDERNENTVKVRKGSTYLEVLTHS